MNTLASDEERRRPADDFALEDAAVSEPIRNTSDSDLSVADPEKVGESPDAGRFFDRIENRMPAGRHGWSWWESSPNICSIRSGMGDHTSRLNPDDASRREGSTC